MGYGLFFNIVGSLGKKHTPGTASALALTRLSLFCFWFAPGSGNTVAIDLIVQHVHSQLEEVRAAWSPGCQWWGRPCLCSGGIAGSSALGAKVGMARLPSVLQACEPRGCPHEALPAVLPPFQRRRLPRPCALVSARLLCKLPSLPARASPLGTNQPSSSDLSDVPSLPAALLGLASPQTLQYFSSLALASPLHPLAGTAAQSFQSRARFSASVLGAAHGFQNPKSCHVLPPA